jgi:hypothetical protein
VDATIVSGRVPETMIRQHQETRRDEPRSNDRVHHGM